MASRALILRLKSTDQVEQAIATHAGTIEVRLNELIQDDLAAGDEPVRWGVGLRALGRRLRRAFNIAEAADATHADELLDDAEPRARRDALAQTAGESISTLRDGLRSTLGTAAEAKLGLVGPTPRQPEEVLLSGQQVLPRVDTAAQGPVLRPGFSFDPAPAKAELARVLPLLQVALLDVAREQKEADATLMDKHQKLAAHDQVFSRVANLTSVLLETIGEYELARRVRPSVRRPGLTVGVDEEMPA